jgi:capsular exopolysaccharide synthesis family protein
MHRSVSKSPSIWHADESSSFSEAYRALKINLDFSVRGRAAQVIGVTSAAPGEGKSTTSLHLAAAYARANRSVALVDADVRRPTLHYAFGRSDRAGLADYLAGSDAALSDLLVEGRLGGLSFLPAGARHPNPSELLASPRMDALLEELRRRFDAIVVDTPPVLAAIDAKVIGAKCDGMLFVVECGKVKRDAARKAQEELKQANIRLFGAVLNKVADHASQKYPYFHLSP